MTPSQIKKAFSSDQIQNLEITKKSQIYSYFLTSRHKLSPYPILSDTKFHLNPGQKLKILGFNKYEIIVMASTPFPEYTGCSNPTHSPQIFTIHNSDIKRFTKVI